MRVVLYYRLWVLTQAKINATNYFRLEPQASGSAAITANKIIRFSLPSNCLLNTRGISFNFNADANAVASAGGRLPADLSSLIDRVELSSGGVQIAQGANGYGLIVAMKKALTVDKCDVALGHPEIVRATSYVDGGGDWATGSSIAALTSTKNENYRADAGQVPFAITNWEGFLGSVQPSIIDTSLLSDLTLTLYLADNSVCSSSAGVALNGTGSTDITDVNTTAQAQYQIRDFHLIVETLGLADSVYDMMIEKRISQVGYVELPFKSFYTFNDTHSGTTRFTVASQSLDRVWVGFRNSTYADLAAPVKVAGYKDSGGYVSGVAGGATYASPFDMGKPTYDVGGILGTNAEKYRGNYFTFVESLASAGTPATYQFNFNGSFIPQFKASAEQMLTVSRNSVPTIDMGTGKYPVSLMTLDQYKRNFFVNCVRLNLPQSEENREISGADTRGISLNAYFTSTGFSSGKNIFIVCECTSSLRIGAGRQIEVIA
jgi:hypothetical protein